MDSVNLMYGHILETKEVHMRKIYLCGYCIQGMQSHMESIYVGQTAEEKCEHCGEEYYPVMKCLWDIEGEYDE